jgi:hypothetical protein
VLTKEQSLYRLDFTLSGALAAKDYIGTFLLRRTGELPSPNSNVHPLTLYQASTSETNVYTPKSRKLSSKEVLILARSWIAKCIGPDYKYCPDGDFRNQFSFHFSQSVQQASATPSNPNGSSKPLTTVKTYIDLNPPFYLTRLIELGSVDVLIVKLIITRNGTHRNNEDLKKPHGQYLTLSHCWGKIANPFCLNARNLNPFRESGIPLAELPQTFQDAVHFARRLSSNVSYIWIDSLCIIQRDGEDWLYESAKMHQVYRNSYCNISATAAKDGLQGLYAERDPQHLWGVP